MTQGTWREPVGGGRGVNCFYVFFTISHSLSPPFRLGLLDFYSTPAFSFFSLPPPCLYLTAQAQVSPIIPPDPTPTNIRQIQSKSPPSSPQTKPQHIPDSSSPSLPISPSSHSPTYTRTAQVQVSLMTTPDPTPTYTCQLDASWWG